MNNLSDGGDILTQVQIYHRIRVIGDTGDEDNINVDDNLAVDTDNLKNYPHTSGQMFDVPKERLQMM